jgi:hypothetical protein
LATTKNLQNYIFHRKVLILHLHETLASDTILKRDHQRFILSNGSHLGWMLVLSDTIQRPEHSFDSIGAEVSEKKISKSNCV